MSPIHLRGRDPSDCPCGAAALYAEVMGEDAKVTGCSRPAVRGAAGAAATAAAVAAAELEAKAAAHKLVRAKAYAHLLTRGTKAVAYANLQVRSEGYSF